MTHLMWPTLAEIHAALRQPDGRACMRTALPGTRAILASPAPGYMNSSGCMPPLDSMVVHKGTTQFEHYERRPCQTPYRPFASGSLSERAGDHIGYKKRRKAQTSSDCAPITTCCSLCSSSLPSASDSPTVSGDSSPIGRSNRQRPFRPNRGDGFDADDDFHRLPRQAGNASILDTQTAYPRFLTLAPVQD